MDSRPEFVRAVTALKQGIAAAVNTELNTFHRATGVSPESIDLELDEITARGDQAITRIVSAVHVRLIC